MENRPIGYSASPDRSRGCRARSILLICFVLVASAAGVACWRYPWMLSQMDLVYWQRQCQNYLEPVGTVAYERDPAEVVRLLGMDPRYRIMRTQQQGVTHIGIMPKCWDKYAQCVPSMAGEYGCVIFLHGMKARDGHEVLMVIGCTETFLPGGRLSVVSTQLSMQTPWRRRRTLIYYDSGIGDWFAYPPGYDPMRFYAGQPDPNDSSHFTIRYTMQGKEGLLEGWVQDSSTTRWINHFDGEVDR